MSCKFSVHINLPAKLQRASVSAGFGTVVVLYIDWLIILIWKCLGIVPIYHVKVDAGIPARHVVNELLQPEMDSPSTIHLRMKTHFSFQHSDNLELWTNGNNSRYFEASSNGGKTYKLDFKVSKYRYRFDSDLGHRLEMVEMPYRPVSFPTGEIVTRPKHQR